MKYLKIALVVLVITAFAVIAVSAQNDPATDADANACLEGGSMEGKCNQDTNGDGTVSQAEIDWAWACGWYLIRYEQGLLSSAQVPSDCQILTGYVANPFCFSYLGYGFESFLYDGVAGDENYIYYPSGNCHKAEGYNYQWGNTAIVEASNYDEAWAACESIYGEDLVYIQVVGDGLWFCWGPLD